ncbi:hypothetical protein QYF36_011733 [Acer negundo]|nr:hypothetical protein QYF36_011733 [Acer negundo]
MWGAKFCLVRNLGSGGPTPNERVEVNKDERQGLLEPVKKSVNEFLLIIYCLWFDEEMAFLDIRSHGVKYKGCFISSETCCGLTKHSEICFTVLEFC